MFEKFRQRRADPGPCEPGALRHYFEGNHDGALIHKWDHYFDVYESHFRPFVGRPLTLVEFGVSHGGSLAMWRHYFGVDARIVGVDINPECSRLGAPDIEIFIADQADAAGLRELAAILGPVDIVIDDGGHTVEQQNTTFEVFFPSVRSPGVYLVEDLHTNYWSEFGGGLRRQGTFWELAKQRTDQLNAWHSRDPESLAVDEFTRSTSSMHFYDSIVVFTKAAVAPPSHRQIGRQTLTELEQWGYRAGGPDGVG